MAKKRITYLDMAKGVGIIMVVMRHSQLMSDTLYNALASIIMPLFFVVSGMLMQHIGEEKRSMKEIVIRKARTLLIPYITFSLTYLLLNGITHLIHPEVVDFIYLYKLFIYFISLAGISVMWFLPTMFFSEIFFLGIRKITSHRMTIMICALAGIAGIWISPVFNEEFWFMNMPVLAVSFFLAMLVRSIIAAIFLCFGYYVKKYLKERDAISLPELFTGISLLACTMYINILNGTVDLHFMEFNHVWMYFLCASLGSLAIILICKNTKQFKLLIFLGVNSLIIMATHVDWMLLARATEWSMILNQYITRAKVYFLWLSVTVIILGMEIIVIFVIDQFGYFMLGKKRPDHRTLNIVKYLKGKIER